MSAKLAYALPHVVSFLFRIIFLKQYFSKDNRFDSVELTLLTFLRRKNDLLAEQRDELLARVAALYARSESSEVPSAVRQFHSLRRLDRGGGRSAALGGAASALYKCVSAVDGRAYVLRRLVGFRLQSEEALAAVALWRRLAHPGVGALHDAFVSKDFGSSNELVFVYDYYPNAASLSELCLPTAASNSPVQVCYFLIVLNI